MMIPVALGLHLLAAMTWIGGMLFLSLVLLPVMRRGGGLTGERHRLFHESARRFRWLVWLSVAVLVVTGPLLLSGRTDTVAKAGVWVDLFMVKLSLVGVLIVLTGVHDFWLGPLRLRTESAATGHAGPGGRWIMRVVPWLARLGLVLGLAVAMLGAVLVKG